MKISLFDTDEFVEINKLQEITSPVVFEHGGIPNPKGLISNEIFGINVRSRKETFAYIDLAGHFIHPHIYKIIKRIFRNIDKIVNGEEYFVIDKEGHLQKDPEGGETGIEWLYENWGKIKWDGNGGMSSERADLISKSKKNEIWTTKQIVIPAFYRDIHSTKGGGGETTELNNYYTRLIRQAALLRDRDIFDISFHTTNYNIQNTMVAIYDYFKDKLDKKNGMLRKYLMGKNVDYCSRTVISAPMYSAEYPEDNIVSFRYAAVPLAQVCDLCYPFIVHWLRNFFERELLENQFVKYNVNLDTGEENEMIRLKNPESYFNDEYIKKHLDRYIRDTSSRFNPIVVPTDSKKEQVLTFHGRYRDLHSEESSIFHRKMTWTDLLYLAACDVTADKHIMTTRYPILDNFGIFIARIRVLSTIETTVAEINGHIYKWYPVIDFNMPKNEIANNFIDSTQFSNSYLKGLGGDYDGDQTTSKIFWTQEANEECERVMNSKSFILSSNGKNVRIADLEPIQTFYVLTKDPVK